MKKSMLCAWVLVLISMPYWAFSQSRQITGTVSDEKGDPLAAVSVQQKGTATGTTTDEKGGFAINVTGGNAVLVFSYAGRQSQEVVVGASNTYNISLSNTGAMSEVVVTALGIRRNERALGYSTQEVKGDNLTLTKEQNVLGSLSGKIAGVQVVGSSGTNMGGTQKIKIRGVNSIRGTDQPLIVIDGTPISNDNFASSDKADFGNLGQDVNPEDIESINVLKGPAASALYGLRGQFGVIMITTKKGKKGAKKVNVQLNSAYSVEKASNFFPLQNVYGGGSSLTWRTLANGQKYVDMSIDESWGPKMDGTPVRQIYSFYPQDAEYGQLTPFVAHPDNIESYYENGSTINNGITVTGGNESSIFRLSFNDTRIQGVEPNTWLRRNNLGFSSGFDLTSKLNVTTNFNFATNTAQRPLQGSEWGARYMVQWFQRNVDMARMKNYKYPDGTFLHWNLNRPGTNGEITDFKPLYWNNPYFEAYENPSNDRRDRFFGDVGVTYQLLADLKLSGFVRGDFYTQNIEERNAVGGTRTSSYAIAKYQNRELNYEFLAQYNKTWGDISLNANLGGNLFSRRYNYTSQSTAGGLSVPGWYTIAASVDRPTSGREDYPSYLSRKEIRSGYGMASIGYKNTYFIDASLRNDNSSALPSGNNSYWYPSLSGSLVFSELLKWNPLSFGKIRLSYAKAGSDLAPYQTSIVYSAGTVYTGVANTLAVPDNLNNSDIRPSFANSYEAGIDLQFFKNRLGIDFTYYQQKNKDQIISLDVSGASGYATTTINAGLIENKGVELTLTGSPVRSKNFSWDASFNAAHNKNKIVELAHGLSVFTHYSTTYSGVTSFLNSYEGKEFGSLVGKAYQRDAATGMILLGSNNMPLYTDATYNFGTVLPDYTGGFQNTFRVYGFDLGAMIDYQVGGQFFSRTKMLLAKTGMAEETAAINEKGKNVRDPLTEGGGVHVVGISAATKQLVDTYVDARTYYRTTLGTHVYEQWLYDASYIKLREVRLGYTFSKSLIGKLPFTNVNLALIARNPAMLWQKAPEGLDPSELSTGAQAISWFESGQANTVRSYGINLTINF